VELPGPDTRPAGDLRHLAPRRLRSQNAKRSCVPGVYLCVPDWVPSQPIGRGSGR
jgi:hypothetical protein